MIELERTFLAKYLPTGLKDCKSKEIIDTYLPKDSRHSALRIRKNGDKYEIMKKTIVEGTDSSKLLEQSVPLTREEYESLVKVDGNKTHKIRYYYNHEGRTAEIDIFQDNKAGLVIVDFEFETEQEKDAFKMPDFCLCDVTQEEAFAGGVLCAKTYEELEPELKKHSYAKLVLE